jgi:hypothetical protein
VEVQKLQSEKIALSGKLEQQRDSNEATKKSLEQTELEVAQKQDRIGELLTQQTRSAEELEAQNLTITEHKSENTNLLTQQTDLNHRIEELLT